MTQRTVFFVSDGTGITAETFGNPSWPSSRSNLGMCAPFIDSIEKALQVAEEINATGEREGQRPIAFATLVNAEVLDVFKRHRQARVLDMISSFIEPLEDEFGVTSTTALGASPTSRRAVSTTTASRPSTLRWRTTMANLPDIWPRPTILLGVSRSGKTPTSLYLAMQHGIKAANYPLIPEDFERRKLPTALVPLKRKCFGLTIDPERLASIRNERRPGSKYAELLNCRYRSQRGRGDDEA